jgi:hypothetical protein
LHIEPTSRTGDRAWFLFSCCDCDPVPNLAQEHKKVEKLEGIVASFAATVKEQAEQIQKVNAQLEISKPAQQMALNNP